MIFPTELTAGFDRRRSGLCIIRKKKRPAISGSQCPTSEIKGDKTATTAACELFQTSCYNASRLIPEVAMKCPHCGEQFDERRMSQVWRLRSQLVSTLERNGWNRTHTAKEIGMSLRTVRLWISQLKAAGFEIKDAPHWRKYDRKTDS